MPEVKTYNAVQRAAEGHSNFLDKMDTTKRQLGLSEIMKFKFALDSAAHAPMVT